MRPLRRTASIVGIVALTAATLVAGAATAQAAPASGTYLSLGDSLAFGYQPDLVASGDFDPTHYVGYAGDLAAMNPHLSLVNFGCPGETTGTMIGGGCSWLQAGLPLHDGYGAASSQLQAAVQYLATHPDVTLVTLDIGSNDLRALVASCNGDAACVAAALPAFISGLLNRYGYILTALRTVAPTVHVVVLGLYNPLVLDIPGSDALLSPVNSYLSQLAAAFGADFVDTFSVMNHRAGSPEERAFVCSRTWECTTYHDIHPSQTGYRVMAVAVNAAV